MSLPAGVEGGIVTTIVIDDLALPGAASDAGSERKRGLRQFAGRMRGRIELLPE